MNLKEARLKAGMTIDALARDVGVSSAAICRYEKGKRVPRLPIAKRIGEKLGIPWYEIMNDQKSA